MKSAAAFTLVELMMVLAVLGILGLVILPTLAATNHRTSRAGCQNNLRQIAVAVTAHAADNNDTVYPLRDVVPIALRSPLAAAKQLGLEINSAIPSIWTCPERPGLPLFEVATAHVVIGYQYFGGLTTWNTPLGSLPARSPVKLSQSQPYWTLAADPLIKIGNLWAGQVVPPSDERFIVYSNMPPHRTPDTFTPQGGNQVFADGSARWIDLEKMYRLTGWNGAYGPAWCHFYQDPIDFPAALKSALPNLAAQP
jgi:prepilin-type N-terminal cleavage/methylation domain-containing protein